MSASRLKRSSVKGKAVARCRNLAQQSALRSASTENEEREFDSIVEDVNIQGIEALLFPTQYICGGETRSSVTLNMWVELEF